MRSIDADALKTVIQANRDYLVDCNEEDNGRGNGMRTESTAQTIAKVGEIIRQTPTTEIAQSCVVPILSEIALSLAAIADRLNETSGIEGISMDEVTK